MTEQGRLRVGDTIIDYEVRRSKRRKKTVQITVDGGVVQVIAPATTCGSELQAIMRRRAPWILSRASDCKVATKPKHFVSGETLPYLGRNVRMIVADTDVRSAKVRFDHWRFLVTAPERLDGEERYESIRRAVVGWFRSRAEEWLREAVDHWYPRLGHCFSPRVLVRDQRLRWGSCSPDGTLRFNWRVMMLKQTLIEYVVVHELAHLTHRNHSQDFWALVSSTLPDAQQRRQQLREIGRSLPL